MKHYSTIGCRCGSGKPERLDGACESCEGRDIPAEPRKFHELVYGPDTARGDIEARFPYLTINDASDHIHEERFEVTGIVSPLEFYRLASAKSWLGCCFMFRLALLDHNKRHWMWAVIKRLNDDIEQNEMAQP